MVENSDLMKMWITRIITVLTIPIVICVCFLMAIILVVRMSIAAAWGVIKESWHGNLQRKAGPYSGD